MKPVTVKDVHGDTGRVENHGDTVLLRATEARGLRASIADLELTPEAARQLGLALIAFSLEAERE